MKPRAAVPRELFARKPPHGSPCTRCGVCCIAVVCELGRSVFGRSEGPCPGLRFDAEKNSSCGVVDDAREPVRSAARLVIQSGDGCDARFNGEPVNHAFNARLDALDVERADEIARARALLGLPEVPDRDLP